MIIDLVYNERTETIRIQLNYQKIVCENEYNFRCNFKPLQIDLESWSPFGVSKL